MQKLGKAAAHHLSALRAAGGFTQNDLAEATGISQGQLSKQLRGFRAINIDELDAICSALDISPHELLRRAEETARTQQPVYQTNGENSKVEQLRVVHPTEGGDEKHKPKASESTPDVAAPDYDALIERINSGEEKVAAQEATEPLEEHFT